MAAPRHGERIEEYEVLEFLGKGGFAQVYRAQCRRSGTYVAVKMIDKALMASAGMVGRVRQEVAIQSRLKHPSILELYTFFEDAHYVYLILELAQNGELARYFRLDAKGLGEQMAADILRQVVDGVLYLHSHRILHRDLSLNNLLLTKDLRVKIADFGLATQLNEPDEKHMTMCGTPNYISPEVASRANHGLPADVWGLGCLLYTLLVGKPPFDTQHVKHTLNRVIHSDYQMPEGLSNEARDLLDRLLKKNPAERITLVQVARHPFLAKSSHDTPFPFVDVNKDSGIHTTSHTAHSTQHNRTRSEERKTTSASYNHQRHNSMDKLSNNYKRPSSFNVLGGIVNVDKHDNVYKNTYDNSPEYSSSNYSGSDGTDAKPAIQNAYTNSYRPLENVQKFNEINPASNFMISEEKHSVHLPSDKMDTNVIKNFSIENKENIVTGNRSIGVPPLCSARLCEVTHRTRNAELSISNNGSVTIKFIKKRGQMREDRITEVCIISKDGMQVVIYSAGGSKGLPLLDPLPPHTPSSQETYSYHNIPQKHWKKYLYASRFVDLVKAKTPKITIYSEHAKCHLMENGTDFEGKFYSGEKFTVTSDGLKIADCDGNSLPNINLNMQIQKAHDHFQECMAKCLLIENALHGLSEDCFPLIMGRRPQNLTASGSSNPPSQQTTPNLPNVGSINIGSFCHGSGNSISHANAIENKREYSSSSFGSNQPKTFNPCGERANPFQMKTNQLQNTPNNASNAAYFNDRRHQMGSYRNG